MEVRWNEGEDGEERLTGELQLDLVEEPGVNGCVGVLEKLGNVRM